MSKSTGEWERFETAKAMAISKSVNLGQLLRVAMGVCYPGRDRPPQTVGGGHYSRPGWNVRFEKAFNTVETAHAESSVEAEAEGQHHEQQLVSDVGSRGSSVGSCEVCGKKFPAGYQYGSGRFCNIQLYV